MKYTILSAKQVDDTLFTEVKYEFEDGSDCTVSIPHFQPKSKEDVIQGIENRFASEQQKLSAKGKCEQIIPELPMHEEIEM